VNIGIICTGHVESWLITWITNRSNDQFTFIKTAQPDTVPAQVRNILSLSAVTSSEMVSDCDAYINTTTSPLLETEFDKIRNRVVHIDFLLNNYASLLHPLVEGITVTSVSLIHSSDKNEYGIVEQGHFKTVEHSLEKQLKSITEQTGFLISDFLSKPLSVKEKTHLQTYKNVDFNRLQKKVKMMRRKHLFQLLFYSYRWNIGIAQRNPDQCLSGTGSLKVNWMKEEKGKGFNADPFMLAGNEGVQLFFEHLESATGKGILCTSFYNKSGFSSYKKVLEKPTHLSYPFTLNYDNRNYLIPENADSGKLTLCEVKDDSIVNEKVLLPVDAVDPTLFQWNNKWWLFCTRKTNKSADLRLYIYFADDLLGEWKPHQQNPVKCDIRNARPAGNLFMHHGKIYRPAQDSSTTYGGRIVINEIKELTEYTYNEVEVSTIEPQQLGSKYDGGVHTVSFCNGYMAVDGKRKVFRFRYI